MTCHNCQHNAEIERLREICTSCALGDKCATSGTFSLDAMTEGAIDTPGMRARRAAGVADRSAFDPSSIDGVEGPTEAELERDALVRLLADLAAIPYGKLDHVIKLVRAFEGVGEVDFGLVQHFLNGGTMTTYAREFGLSKQTAWARCKALFRRHPVFKEVSNGLLGKLKGGRRKAAADMAQAEFDFG